MSSSRGLISSGRNDLRRKGVSSSLFTESSREGRTNSNRRIGCHSSQKVLLVAAVAAFFAETIPGLLIPDSIMPTAVIAAGGPLPLATVTFLKLVRSDV